MPVLSRFKDVPLVLKVVLVPGVLLLLLYVLNILLPFVGIEAVVFTSGSMEPTFSRGDLSVAQEVPIKAVEVGDVVVYESDHLPWTVAHRVVSINSTGETTISTRGDANNHQITVCVRENGRTDISPQCPSGTKENVETGITEDQLRGKVVFSIPQGGYVLRPDLILQ